MKISNVNLSRLFLLPTFCVSLAQLTGCQSANQLQPNVRLWHVQQESADAFSREANALNQSVHRYCIHEGSHPELLLNLRKDWKETMNAWMSLQGVDMGSEELLSLSWQIQFYPDKKNTTGRKISELLKQDTPLTSEYIAAQSVAVQGLGAMEWMLFDSTSDMLTPRHCELAVAISQHLSRSARAYREAWEINPFSMADEMAETRNTLSALSHQLDRVMKKLSMPLGKPGLPKSYQAEAWRSQQSLAFLKQSIISMSRLYQADLNVLLREKGHEALAARLSEHWRIALDSVPESDGMRGRLETVRGYQSLLTVYNNLEYIQLAISDEVAPLLGVVVGFNSTDGD
ncbi:iron-regulated protein A precursor [Veronia nyctiphanis]|uniref:Iron-regulated protein A n=1 Tax=Veronia nyctiphanis TaxID=1278244 RepID=A0A4Q0YSJ9_9GAMM|nr:imelysin family protein [Veronia nyctiphanis]RXJ74210.1 iron-regulated protein A precursor [Veronia nyctiphanis]